MKSSDLFGPPFHRGGDSGPERRGLWLSWGMSTAEQLDRRPQGVLWEQLRYGP